jgi:hypothetical protein
VGIHPTPGCFWAKCAESLENKGVEFLPVQRSAQECEKKALEQKLSSRPHDFASFSKMEELPPHPGVFARVANAGLTGYGTWKNVRRMEEGE